MKTLSAVSAGQQKMIAAGWRISLSTAFLLGSGRHLFEPFSNEFHSLLQIAFYLFCFSLGAWLQPNRKNHHTVPGQLLFAVLINLLTWYLLRRSDWNAFTMPLLFLMGIPPLSCFLVSDQRPVLTIS